MLRYSWNEGKHPLSLLLSLSLSLSRSLTSPYYSHAFLRKSTPHVASSYEVAIVCTPDVCVSLSCLLSYCHRYVAICNRSPFPVKSNNENRRGDLLPVLVDFAQISPHFSSRAFRDIAQRSLSPFSPRFSSADENVKFSCNPSIREHRGSTDGGIVS